MSRNKDKAIGRTLYKLHYKVEKIMECRTRSTGNKLFRLLITFNSSSFDFSYSVLYKINDVLQTKDNYPKTSSSLHLPEMLIMLLHREKEAFSFYNLE